ncbi:hypothetical protein B0H12DRAFT_380891 [Mycena haematopus]|nr:hypothetical protein B0H12DRAFT_380891 [Mycena haematopus]
MRPGDAARGSSAVAAALALTGVSFQNDSPLNTTPYTRVTRHLEFAPHPRAGGLAPDLDPPALRCAATLLDAAMISPMPLRHIHTPRPAVRRAHEHLKREAQRAIARVGLRRLRRRSAAPAASSAPAWLTHPRSSRHALCPLE